jgi:hypothetical protein
MVNILPTSAIVVVSCVWILQEGKWTMVGIFGVMWVQLSQQEYFFTLHLGIGHNYMDSVFSLYHATSTQFCGFIIVNYFSHGPCNGLPHFPASTSLVIHIIGWMGVLPVPDVWCSTYLLTAFTLPYPPLIPKIESPTLSTS